MARTLALPRPPAALSTAVTRYWPLALLLFSALCLIVAEFLTLREIKAVTAVPAGGITKVGAHHGYALALVAVASVPMALGAARGGSRPAAIAVTALGLVAIAVVAAALGYLLAAFGWRWWTARKWRTRHGRDAAGSV